MPEAITSQRAFDAFRAAEAGRFRHAVNEQGELQKTAGGPKAALVAWALSSPGREGSFIGRSVKALVNLGSKGKFQALASSFQRNREASARNMVAAFVRAENKRLDADTARQFSQAAFGRLEFRAQQGARFTSRDFSDIRKTLTDVIIPEQRAARQDALAAIQAGKPTEKMQGLSAADLEVLRETFAAVSGRPAQASGQDGNLPYGNIDAHRISSVMSEFFAVQKELKAQLRAVGNSPDADASLESQRRQRPDVDEHLKGVEQYKTQLRQAHAGLLDKYLDVITSQAKAAASKPGVANAGAQAAPTPGSEQQPAQAPAAAHAQQPETSSPPSPAAASELPTQPVAANLNDVQSVQKQASELLSAYQAEREELKEEQPLPQAQPGSQADEVLLDRKALQAVYDDTKQAHSKALKDYESMRKGRADVGALQRHQRYMQSLALNIMELQTQMDKADKLAAAS